MADPTWRYRVGNEERGPVTANELCALLAQGAIALQTPVWCAAVNKWVPAEVVPGFRQAAARAVAVTIPDLPPMEEPQEASAKTEITVPLEAVTDAATEEKPAASSVVESSTATAPIAAAQAPAAAPAAALAEPSSQASPASVPFVDASAYLPHPWLRFWSRSVDWCLSLIALVVFAALMFFVRGGRSLSATQTLEICGGWFVACLVMEAVMLSVFGVTPGKALLGISVEGAQARRPRFGQALSRSIQVWIFGEGLGIPVLSWMTRLIWLGLLSSGGQTIWDRNTLCRVRHQPCHFLRVASVAMLFCIIPALLFAAVAFMAVSHGSQIQNSKVALKNLWQTASQPAIKMFKTPSARPTPTTVATVPSRPAPKTSQATAVVPVKTSAADDGAKQLAGTWVIVVNQNTGSGTLRWKNSLILQDDGTFRQKVRAARHAAEQSEYSQDWAGNWTIKNNQLIETVTVSTSPQHPAGKYVFDLSNDTNSITMVMQSQPAGAAGSGSHPSYRFHKAMAVADTAE
jgi:hypothetical protein